jgi:hypothetical protein
VWPSPIESTATRATIAASGSPSRSNRPPQLQRHVVASGMAVAPHVAQRKVRR